MLILLIKTLARVTGLEPATSGVTGRRSNQLSYTRSGVRLIGERRTRVNALSAFGSLESGLGRDEKGTDGPDGAADPRPIGLAGSKRSIDRLLFARL